MRVEVHLPSNEVSQQASTTRVSRAQCKEKTSVVFIKTHKSGSTTLIATLQKYAYLHNLSMMVPAVGFNAFNWPIKFKPDQDNLRSPNGEQFDMMVNHIIFNKSSISTVMKPDAQYVTIVRNPIAHLRSAFQYFDLNRDNRFGKGVEAITHYLLDPPKYDSMPSWMAPVLPLADNRINSMTRNLQSADLGLSYWNFDNADKVQIFLEYTMETFHFIVVLERLEESLVLLRRHMCWKLQDIMFISKNVNPLRLFEMKDLSESSRRSALRWNNVDLLLFNAANRRLDILKKSLIGVEREVAAYKSIQLDITRHCWQMMQRRERESSMTVPAGEWNEEFTVDKKFCTLLLLDERDVTHVFKCKQYPSHKDCQEKSGLRVSRTLSMLEGDEPFKFIAVTPRTGATA